MNLLKLFNVFLFLQFKISLNFNMLWRLVKYFGNNKFLSFLKLSHTKYNDIRHLIHYHYIKYIFFHVFQYYSSDLFQLVNSDLMFLTL